MPDLGPEPAAPDGGGGGGASGDMSTGPSYVAGSDFDALYGLTSDGWAIVQDTAKTVWAIRLADKSRKKIIDHAVNVQVYEDTVFASFGDTGPPTLLAWRAAATTTAKDFATNSFGGSPPIADGHGHVAYYTSTTGTEADLVVDTVGAPSPHTVVSTIDLSVGWPRLRFVAGRLIVARCTDLAQTACTVTSFDPATGSGIELSASARYEISVNATAGVLITSSAGQAAVVPPTGGDPRPLASDVVHARLSDNGSVAMVQTSAGELERVAVADGSVTVLEHGGVAYLDTVAPDGSSATYATQRDADTFLMNLFLAHQPGVGFTLNDTITTAATGFDFSADSSWVFYLVDADPTTYAGTLRARPVGASGTVRTLGDHVLTMLPAGGSRVVFCDHVVDTRGDLELVDLAGSAVPTRLATQAYFFFDVGRDGTIAWLQPGDGLYFTR